MNKKLLIGIIVLLVVFVVAVWDLIGQPFADILAFFIVPAVWIYLAWMVWKKKATIFHDQVEPELAERRFKRLKTFLRVAGISLVVVIGFSLRTKYFIPPAWEDPEALELIVFLFVALFIIATIGSLVILLKGRRKTT